jgi:hypothetical protein
LVVLGLAGKVGVAFTLNERMCVVQSVKSFKNPTHVDVAMLLDKQWTDVQDILCPAGRPNAATFGPTLFAMARTELGITSDEVRHVKQENLDFCEPSRPMEKLSYRFYYGRSFANATIYVSGNHTIAYIPIWKAANNGIGGWLRACDGTRGRTIHSLQPENLFNDTTRHPFLKPTCVVTAIRDPISHFLSAYNEIEFRRHLVGNNTDLPLYYNLPFSTAEQRRDRFVQFVRDIALEESRALIHHPFGHVFSMSRVLEVLGRQKDAFLSGYLPTLANLSAKFPSFLQKTCHLEEELPIMRDTRWDHLSSRDLEGFYRAAKTVWSEGGKVARALCILHAMDYACWKDLPDGVPTVCQDVYSRAAFMASIFSL